MSLIRFDEMEDMYGRMDRMMNSMMNNMFNSDPFGFNMMSPFSMSPFSRIMNTSSLFPPAISFGHNLFNNMTQDSSYYCSSSVMSMSTDASGRPLIYEASSSTRSAPGGVRETRSSVRDSASGLQKMSIGHHIQDRGHVMERSRNHYTGEEEQNDEYINIEEDDAPQFNEEWRTRINAYGGHHHDHHRRQIHGVEHDRHDRHNRTPQLALPAPESTHNESHKTQSNKMSHRKHKDKKNKKPYKKV